MKQLVPFSFLLIFNTIAFSLQAQPTNKLESTGNVGIGTISPTQKLTVIGNILVGRDNQLGFALTDRFSYDGKYHPHYGMQWTMDSWSTAGATFWAAAYGGMKFFTQSVPRLAITGSGNVGIGTTSPTQKLTVNGNILVGRDNQLGFALTDRFSYDGKHHPHYGMQWTMDSWSGAGATFWAAAYGGMKFFTQSVPRLAITGAGNIGIGTTSPQAKLAVNGDIHAKKVTVTQAGWPDYVFEQDYLLPSLAELAIYIKDNKHLPGIPSAVEIEEEGLDLGEMDKKLLQKIEELTLYIIEQQKIIANMQEKEAKLEARMLELENK